MFCFVASVAHYACLQQSLCGCRVEALGYIPKDESIVIPSNVWELSIDETFVWYVTADRVAEVIDKTVNVDRLLELCTVEFFRWTDGRCRLFREQKIIARDELLISMYQGNVEALKRAGRWCFSPLRDKKSSGGRYGLLFPRGYPELHLAELAANEEWDSLSGSIVKTGASTGRMWWNDVFVWHDYRRWRKVYLWRACWNKGRQWSRWNWNWVIRKFV